MSLRRMINQNLDGSKRDVVESNPGCKDRYSYTRKIDVDGKYKLEVSDCYDQDEEIQSYEESVNINRILERYAAGDLDALDRAKAFYADVSKIPKNLAQVMDINKQAQNAFNSLPYEVKELYGHDYYRFIHEPEILDEYISSKYIDAAKPNNEINSDSNEKGTSSDE